MAIRSRGTGMARKVEVKLLDDTDGSQADETVAFGVDGSNYEIDLSHKNAERLRSDLEKFLHAARRVGRGGITPSRQYRTGDEPESGQHQPQVQRAVRMADRTARPSRLWTQGHDNPLPGGGPGKTVRFCRTDWLGSRHDRRDRGRRSGEDVRVGARA